MDWKHLLAYITGTVDQELLVCNEYLVTENRILRNQIKGRVQLSDGERKSLAELGQKLGKQALREVATIVKPDTILGWHRKLVAQKFDGSAPNPATTSWLFRAFGEASVHGLCDNLALGNTALSQGKRAVAWGPHALTLFQRPPGVGGQFLPLAGTTTVGPSCAASWPARHRSSIPTRGARVTGAS